MSSQEGGQSPPPERQTGAQLNTAPGDGQGTDTIHNKDEKNQSGLDNLQSNPKGDLEDAVKEKFTKTQK